METINSTAFQGSDILTNGAIFKGRGGILTAINPTAAASCVPSNDTIVESRSGIAVYTKDSTALEDSLIFTYGAISEDRGIT